MGVPTPVPAASWLLREAVTRAEQAQQILAGAGVETWQGQAAAGYRNRVGGMQWATSALITALEDAAHAAWLHEREIEAIRDQWGEAR